MARILKLQNVIERTGKTRSPIYEDIRQGLFPRQIKLGARAVGWAEHEVEAVITARIAGASVEAIRKLVLRLHAARTAPIPQAA